MYHISELFSTWNESKRVTRRRRTQLQTWEGRRGGGKAKDKKRTKRNKKNMYLNMMNEDDG